MNVALRKPWTKDKVLAWVVNQEGRYEFDGVAPVAVTGGSVIHGLIKRYRSAGNYAPTVIVLGLPGRVRNRTL